MGVAPCAAVARAIARVRECQGCQSCSAFRIRTSGGSSPNSRFVHAVEVLPSRASGGAAAE
eukprot:8565723-Alexandrium_andersonii.AAC.1